ncbi:MAG TPA: adenosine deaminase [Candidatus Limnocylindria bacterium]|jgi:adenosine deaminase|nr:adenosine deaminase [Candidatus Limnocylindria bacterium]
MPHPLGDELTELHVHLGGAVDPAAMWGIAHSQGIRLPTKDYWEFVDLITVRKQTRKSFEDFLALYRWTELIQSSPLAVEESVYQVVGGAYRKANITTLELRYNPMKRNRGGERDLDHIIMASIRGLDKALLEYPVQAGLIFCLDRTFDEALNTILVEKAIAYRHRGVVGIDIAGGKNPLFHYRDYSALFKKARKAGLGLTVHAGEDDDWHSVDEVLRYLEPNRIGHGIHAAQDRDLCRRLSERGVLLEICPSSNLDTRVVKDADELGEYIATFKRHKVRFSFNTDGPEMLETTLRDELKLAVRSGWVTKEELAECGVWAREASFLRRNGPV